MNALTLKVQTCLQRSHFLATELVSSVPEKNRFQSNFIAITSPNYPDDFNLTHLDCKWSIRALHGASVVVQLVDADLDDGCFDNILNVVDDTPKTGNSPLKFPGKSAKCGQSDFGSIDKRWMAGSGRTVTVTFKSVKNTGRATFKLEVTSQVDKEGVCPAPSSIGCSEGPCCAGPDCCVMNVGSVAKGRMFLFLMNLNHYLQKSVYLMPLDLDSTATSSLWQVKDRRLL